jgi:curved DNA-binding protein CbpA
MTDYRQFNCYKILGVQAEASYDEIRSAFRSLSKLFHPDVSDDGSDEKQILINLSFEILKDPILRESHDCYWIKRAIPKPNMRASSRPASDGKVNRRKEKATSADRQNRTERRQKQATAGSRTSYENLFERARKETAQKEADIKSSFERRKSDCYEIYERKLRNRRFNFVIRLIGSGVLCAACFFFPLAFFIAAPFSAFFLIPAARADVEYDNIFVLTPRWKDRVARASKLSASFAIENELMELSRYPKILRITKEEMIRGSRSSDSEKAVAARLAIAFFLMGYSPVGYDLRTRTIRLVISNEVILVRYRHRKGSPTNVAYLKKLKTLMEELNAQSGFVFSSPGLSGKALVYAKENNIASYSLKEMNEWIKSVYKSGHAGPGDSILDALSRLSGFLSEVARS